MTGVTVKRSVQEVAEFVGARLVGDGAVELTGVASIQSASPGDLVFVDDEKKSPPAPRASIRLWIAVLLSVIALWFVDGLLKPASRRPNSGRK